MKISFSEYTIVEKTTQALDPLGLTAPANALRDALFPQFTVLTRHPVHLGLLCAIWMALDASPPKKAAPRARRFRELELLWGIACAAAGERPVNITKFARLHERGLPASLTSVPGQDAVYQRLGYGTLGHYSRPAMTWGLLRRGSDGLTPLGRRLGEGFAARAPGSGLASLFDRWRHGEAFDDAALVQIARKYGLAAQASPAERTAWRDAIAQHVDAAPERHVLWDAPIDHDTLRRAEDDAPSWRLLWSEVQSKYPTRRPLLDRIDHFERLTAGLQFLFDCQLARAEFTGEAGRFRLPTELGPKLFELAKDHMTLAGLGEAAPLVARAAQAGPKLSDIDDSVLDHHVAHHQKKGVRPFLTRDGIQVRGRADRRQLASVLADVATADGITSALDAIQYRYRRDWHFAKCRRWKDHADGLREDA
jgi:hypothetical protein